MLELLLAIGVLLVVVPFLSIGVYWYMHYLQRIVARFMPPIL